MKRSDAILPGTHALTAPALDDWRIRGQYGLGSFSGPVAQLGEHLVCNQGVRGSSPLRSTISLARSEPSGLGARPSARRRVLSTHWI
jgi:hypothetical protein